VGAERLSGRQEGVGGGRMDNVRRGILERVDLRKAKQETGHRMEEERVGRDWRIKDNSRGSSCTLATLYW
jgi:hypothetical protein